MFIFLRGFELGWAAGVVGKGIGGHGMIGEKGGPRWQRREGVGCGERGEKGLGALRKDRRGKG